MWTSVVLVLGGRTTTTPHAREETGRAFFEKRFVSTTKPIIKVEQEEREAQKSAEEKVWLSS